MAWKMMSFKLCEEHSTRQTMTRDRAVTQAICHGAQKKGQLLRVMCRANVLEESCVEQMSLEGSDLCLNLSNQGRGHGQRGRDGGPWMGER